MAATCLGSALGLGLAETAVSGSNRFAALIEGWDGYRFEHPAHAVGVVLGMSILGAASIYLIVVPLIRRTGLVSEKTLQTMVSRRGGWRGEKLALSAGQRVQDFL